MESSMASAGRSKRRPTVTRWLGLLLGVAILRLVPGCARGPMVVPFEQQKTIDRSIIEYPAGLDLTVYARFLTAPAAFAFDNEHGEHYGSLIVAESGIGGTRAKIYGFKPDGTRFDVWPRSSKLPPLPSLPNLPFDLGHGPFGLYGPIGGIAISGGKIFVTHRDRNGRGVVTAFDYSGNHYTVAADFPAQGDYGMTDIAVAANGRLYFGVGSATNSGVVGMDNWAVGWVRDHPDCCDLPATDLSLLGYRFNTPNPLAGLFGPGDTAVTAPFQPFNVSNQIRVQRAPNGKPTGAIYSVDPGGGIPRLEATGIHNPRGIAFDELGYKAYFTNDGMEMRGTRPVKDDRDAVLYLVASTWYGFPDFTADLHSVGESSFQPPTEMMIRSGYPELRPVVDLAASGLTNPANYRDLFLYATFPSLSGAAHLTIVSGDGPLKEYNGKGLVALFGDRAPFATNGVKLRQPVGYKVVMFDPSQSNGPVTDFIHNTAGLPEHLLSHLSDDALERPIDVKLGPDGALYVLDFGPMNMRGGHESVPGHSGRIFRLGTKLPPTTRTSEPQSPVPEYFRHSNP